MTIEELEKMDKQLNLMIEDLAKKKGLSNKNCEPVYDGLCCPELYLNSPLRVLWILKEPYDEICVKSGKPQGGGWSMPKDVFHPNGNNKDFRKGSTGQMIIYSTYGIINNKKWYEMDYICDDVTMADVLHQIAYINLSKMPGLTSSKDGDLKKKYEIWKEVTLEQIKQYKPNVLIFGNTYKFFEDDLEQIAIVIKKEEPHEPSGNNFYYTQDNRIICDVWHPSKRFSKEGRETYVNSMVEKVNKWHKRLQTKQTASKKS